jgi:hypothetical protein
MSATMREAVAKAKARQSPFDVNTPRGKFFEENGDYVQDGVEIIFETGAVAENTGNEWGTLFNPPEDDLERAKVIARYRQLKVTKAIADFKEYKAYLEGKGRCLDEAAYLHTHEEQYDFLLTLKKRVETAKRYLRRANQAIEDATPDEQDQRVKGFSAEDYEYGFRKLVNEVRI